jgi:hypothetical protein
MREDGMTNGRFGAIGRPGEQQQVLYRANGEKTVGISLDGA